MTEVNMIEAINLALTSAMQEDANVIILGEDVGVDGGVFRATDGLIDRFGAGRVRDTPIAEAAIAGVSVGAAAQGLKPVAEIQFSGFIYPAIDQILNHASRLRNRTRGRLTCPLVLRAPYGSGVKAPEHHSESPEALFTHIPGIRTVIPSSPKRAYGLLLSAIRSPDPVIFLEPKRLYRSTKETVETGDAALPLDQCFKLRDGHDETLIAWGALDDEALKAADQLNLEGVAANVIDVATLSPLDDRVIIASVEKTGRCVIAHEAAMTGGFAAEISARLADKCLTSLLAPIKRVTGLDAVMPYFRLETAYLPAAIDISTAVQDVMAYS